MVISFKTLGFQTIAQERLNFGDRSRIWSADSLLACTVLIISPLQNRAAKETFTHRIQFFSKWFFVSSFRTLSLSKVSGSICHL